MAAYAPGALVRARGREWVVQPESTADFLVVRPLNGDTDFTAGLFAAEAEPASFPPPAAVAGQVGDHAAAGLLRTALRVGFTSSAGPFRSLASISVEPRQYQLVPLLLALRMEPVRLLIGDDVGIGKTIEAGLIAKELLAQGEASGLTVLCSPALAEQWQAELRDKFAIEATLVLPSTATKLERDLRGDESIFDRHPITVVSTDFIKAPRREAQFRRTCRDLVIVDEAHTCVGTGGSGGAQRQLRYELLHKLANDPDRPQRHLVLVTATPHSGKEQSFRDLIALLDPDLATVDLESVKGRDRLAARFVQRRRRDIRRYLDQDTPFPGDRETKELAYSHDTGYATLIRNVLDYARETVGEPGGGLAQRVRWWSALALLRSVASSPRAAVATLSARSVTAAAETAAEADDLGRSSVLDLTEEETFEGVDAAPGADDEEFPAPSRQRLKALARDFGRLEGVEHDAKLRALVKEVKGLLASGFDPIVFCRFIPTAEYVAEHLGKALGRKAHVTAVTGQLPPEARAQRIGELTAEHGRHVLVATDCLSEGVNLQEHFQAVVHYDLAWNPTRHEQREGRVDRFGQRVDKVRAVTLYGCNTLIDGLVLDVLIRKHVTIQRQTGVAVPVPDAGNSVVQALIDGLLLRGQEDEQLALDVEVGQTRDQLHKEWESAAERESRAVTKYAHSGVKLDEVEQEVAEIRAALGTRTDITRFTRDALSDLGAVIEPRLDGFTAKTLGLPIPARYALGLIDPGDDGPPPDLAFHPDLPAPPGEHALVRTDPFIEALAQYVLDAALDGQGPGRRCGVIRSGAVSARTVLLLIRYRFHLKLPGRDTPRTLIAEDAQLAAFRTGPDGAIDWLPDGEATALATATPDANVLPELVERGIARALAELPAAQAHLEARGAALADRLKQAHLRVRGAVGARRRGLDVTANQPADVLGVYVYLPAGGAR
jgi:Helicase conserved C-terminal domain/DEAD/DEAH box helicase